jgi:hypothetical protein
MKWIDGLNGAFTLVDFVKWISIAHSQEAFHFTQLCSARSLGLVDELEKMALDSTNVLSMVHFPLVYCKAYVSPQQRGISKFSIWFFCPRSKPAQA